MCYTRPVRILAGGQIVNIGAIHLTNHLVGGFATSGPEKLFWRTFTPSTRSATLARSWRPPRGPQGDWEAVLVDPGTRAARFDAWSAARGLWGWCVSRARPADPDDRLQAHVSRARRSKRTRHPSLTRDHSSSRCAVGAAGGEPMWLWCRRCRHHLWLLRAVPSAAVARGVAMAAMPNSQPPTSPLPRCAASKPRG